MTNRVRHFVLTLLIFLFYSWGFHAHKTINKTAVYLLPAQLSPFFIKHIDEIEQRSVSADKRRYVDSTEAIKHYIDIDLYGENPFDSIPDHWMDAKQKYTQDTLFERGILPWVIFWEYKKLVNAMDSGSQASVIRHASDLGHYVADACVPLHTTSNYNGQFTHQKGIHSLWETRIPESFSGDYEYYIGNVVHLPNPLKFSWILVKESHALIDSTLSLEKRLSDHYKEDGKYRFKIKNGQIGREYSKEYVNDYNLCLDGMVERRLQRAIRALASFWYSAWIEAGMPDLTKIKVAGKEDISDKPAEITPNRIHE